MCFPWLWHVTDERLFQTISYKLPSQSYAIFRLKTHQILKNEVEDVRQRRHLEFPNPLQARQEQCKNHGELEQFFPQCSTQICAQNSEEIGQCLLENYPQMSELTRHSLNDELFENDETCTAFVRDFFAQCRNFIPSCQEVKGNQRLALTVLGCLFSHYSDLMLPLLKQYEN